MATPSPVNDPDYQIKDLGDAPIHSLVHIQGEIVGYISDPAIQALIAQYDPDCTPLNDIARARATTIDRREDYVLNVLFMGLRQTYEETKRDIADPTLPEAVKVDIAAKLAGLATFIPPAD